MKKFILVLLTVVVATALTTKLSAQYSIPSYDVPVIADPTTFEETPVSNAIGFGNVVRGVEEEIQDLGSRDERIILTKTIDDYESTTAWAVIIIYSLDNTINYGPYTVYEDIAFNMNLSTDYEWGVKVVDASQGCQLSVWYE